MARRKSGTPAAKAAGAAERKKPQDPLGPAAAPEAAEPPPGLDDAGHAAAQRAAHRAEVLRQGFVPACMATALGTNGQFDAPAFHAYLQEFVRDAGDPRDPVERVLVEQLAFAHLRLADLHAQAAGAKAVDAIKVLTAASARLLAEVRRLGLTLRAFRERAPTTEAVRLAQVG
jgi:hypothetical protein